MSEDIAAPKRPDHYPDRSLDCQLALEPALQDLAKRTQAAGWSEDDVSTALMQSAHNDISGIIANRKTELDIEDAAWSVL